MSARPAECPCGAGHALAEGCGRWHAGEPAPTAEALMRSRYAAYVLGLDGYLLASWHPRTRPAAIDIEPGTQWLGLKVLAAADTGPDRAEVEFVARYKVGGRPAVRMHERSRFVREDGRWYYVDGDFVGRSAGGRGRA